MNVFMVFAMSLTNVDVKMVGLEQPVMNVLTCLDAYTEDAKEGQILVNVTMGGWDIYAISLSVLKVVMKNMVIVKK